MWWKTIADERRLMADPGLFGLAVGECLGCVWESWLITSWFNISCSSRRCCECLRCCGRRDPRPRTVWLGHPEKRDQRYPRNVINNQKYNFFTFLPGVSVKKVASCHPTQCCAQVQCCYRRWAQEHMSTIWFLFVGRLQAAWATAEQPHV